MIYYIPPFNWLAIIVYYTKRRNAKKDFNFYKDALVVTMRFFIGNVVFLTVMQIFYWITN